MTIVFSDNYTADSDTTLASRVPDVGTGYTRIWSDGSNPTFTVDAANDDLRGATANNSGCIYTLDATYPSADYDFVFLLKAVVSFSSRPFYVGVRGADQENMYAVRLTNVTSGGRLYKKVSGTWTPLGSAFSCPAAGSICKLEIIGNVLKFYDDGVEVASATDSDLTAAGKPIYALGGGAELVDSTDDANSAWQIDSITVTDLGSSPVNLTGVGNIASAEALGSAVVSVAVAPSGVGSGEGFGSPALTVDVVGAGNIASTEAFGTPVINVAVAPSGIGSGEAFGSPSLSVDIASAGNIASSEAFGEPVVSVGAPVNVTEAGNIASTEAFGTPVISLAVAPSGIGSGEAFGSPSLSVDIASAGNIASSESFGEPNVSTEAPVNLTEVGNIASAEAFGTPDLEARLEPAGIASSELFGAPTFVMVIAPVGIASLEAFGVPLVGNVFRTITVDSVAVETVQVSCAVDDLVSVTAVVQTLYAVESEDAP